MSSHLKYPKIRKFAHVVRDAAGQTVTYRGKIKLHGTNAGIRIHRDGTIQAQSRTRDITPDDDNCGFAAWVASTRGSWLKIAADHDICVFGEWAGPGVNKGDAVAQIPSKRFFPFGVAVLRNEGIAWTVEPEEILDVVAPTELNDIHVIPWATEEIRVDMGDELARAEFAAGLSARVDDIAKRDPYIWGRFGVNGPGEGLVMYALSEGHHGLTFKAKREGHGGSGGKRKTRIPVDIERLKTISDFADRFVDTARLHQGVREACGGVVDTKLTPDFMKWIGRDVKAESGPELEESGLDWKDIAKTVNSKAARWYSSGAPGFEG